MTHEENPDPICLLLVGAKTVIGSWRNRPWGAHWSDDDPTLENVLVVKKLRWPDGAPVATGAHFRLVPLEGHEGPTEIRIHDAASIVASYKPSTRISELYAQHLKAFEASREPDDRPPSDDHLALEKSARELEACKRELETRTSERDDALLERDEVRRDRDATTTLIRDAIEEVDGPSPIVVPPRVSIRLLIHQRDKARAERDEALSLHRSYSERETPEG